MPASVSRRSLSRLASIGLAAICLSGWGNPSAAAVVVAPTAIDFGLQRGSVFGNGSYPSGLWLVLIAGEDGGTSEDVRQVALTNTGPAPIQIVAVTPHGVSLTPLCPPRSWGGSFYCQVILPSTDCGTTFPIVVLPGASCHFPVYFVQDGIGQFNGSLEIATEAPDSPHVVSITATRGILSYAANTTTNGAITLVQFASGPPAPCPMTAAEWLSRPGTPGSVPATGLPPGSTFPFGVFSFRTAQCPLQVTQTARVSFPNGIPPDAQYWAFGITPESAMPHWFRIPATIEQTRVTFSLSDGAIGDADMTGDGVLISQTGVLVLPSPTVAHAVPALAPIVIALLSLSFGMAGIITLRPK